MILIDHLNGVAQSSEYLRTLEGASISVITRAGVRAGSPAEPVVRLLDRYPALPIERETADLAAELRRKHKWRLPDAFQAALAQLHGLKLATRNTRDFPPQRHAFVVVPYTKLN